MNEMVKLLIKVAFCLFILFNLCEGRGLDPAWKKAIVLIEKAGKTTEGEDTLVAHGTGCIIWHYGQPKERILLTNEHILAGRDSILLRFNRKSEHILEDSIGYVRQVLWLRAAGQDLWTAHPDSQVDLAAMAIQLDTLADVLAYPLSLFRKIDTENEGDEILFLGFPLGLAGVKKNYPIMRSGIVALITNEGFEAEDVFLIDAQVFAGNSGSPVFLKPARLATEDIVFVSTADFIGIVSGHIDAQRRSTIGSDQLLLSVKFSENSGLGKVIPAERVAELLELLWGKTIEEIQRGD